MALQDKKREKPKQAIALEYDPDEAAPRVIATGLMCRSIGMISWQRHCRA